MVSDKAADLSSLHTSTSSSSSLASPRSKVVPTRRLARKPFEKITEVDTRMEQENNIDGNSIVTPAKNETVVTSSSAAVAVNKGSHALFSFSSKENRTRKSVSYSAVAKGITTTTTTSSSNTVEIVAQSVTDIEATLNTTTDENTEEKVTENVIVVTESTENNTEDFVPAKKTTTPRGAADKKRRIELRRASNGGVSRTTSSLSSTTATAMDTSTVAPIKKPQTTWTIPAATGTAWKKSSTSTPVTPIEVPVVESSSTPKVNIPVAPLSRTSSAVSTTSTSGKTNFASFAAAVSRQQSLKSGESTVSGLPSISVTALETTHNLSTPSTPILSSSTTTTPLLRSLTRSSTGNSGSWVNIVGTKPAVDQHNTSTLDLDASVLSADNDGNTSVMTNDTKQRNVTIEPLTEKKLARRQKDIDMGKTIKGYSNYIAAVPVNKRDLRKREHPMVSIPYNDIFRFQ